jgi:hypothetical protein
MTPIAAQAPNPKWRVIVGDRYGNTIANVSPIAIGRQYVAILNRPAQFAFKVPSNDVRVSSLASDGYPLVSEGRTVRAFRYEAQADGTSKWVVRFAGEIWQIEDEGGEVDAWTTCVCFDPLQRLNRRFARLMYWYGDSAGGRLFKSEGANGGNAADGLNFTFTLAVGPFTGFADTSFSATDIARGLLNATNVQDGFSGLIDAYSSQTYADFSLSAGARLHVAYAAPPQTALLTPQYDHKRVGEAITDLCAGYNMFDLQVVPLDGTSTYTAFASGLAPDYNGGTQYTLTGGTIYPPSLLAQFRPLAQLAYVAGQRGSSKPNVVFSWGESPHNVRKVKRTIDLEQLVNNALAVGASGYGSSNVDPASIARLGAGMDYESYTDVTDSSQLTALAREATLLGKGGAPTYSITPQPGNTFLPFDSFDLGDIVTVQAGAKLRGGFSGLHRVYGYTLDILDDSSQEVLSSLTTSPVV